MTDEPKAEKYLDRYEVVAVALPGAALLLFAWYLYPALFGAAKFELKDISVGTLGVFAIAAVIAGEVVQAIANLAEELLNIVADLVGRTPADSLPANRKEQFARVIAAANNGDSKAFRRRRYRKELGKEISRTARQHDSTGALQIANVSYGLHRGLAVASGVAVALALALGARSQAVAFALVFAAVSYRAIRFSRRYEGEALCLYLDSQSAGQKLGPDGPPDAATALDPSSRSAAALAKPP
jgi:hypothetical protein